MNEFLISIGLLVAAFPVIFTLTQISQGTLGGLHGGENMLVIIAAVFGSVSLATGYLGMLIKKHKS